MSFGYLEPALVATWPEGHLWLDQVSKSKGNNHQDLLKIIQFRKKLKNNLQTDILGKNNTFSWQKIHICDLYSWIVPSCIIKISRWLGPWQYLGKEDNFRQFCYNYDIQQFGIFFDNPSSKADKVQLFIFFYSVTIAKQARKQASFFPVAVSMLYT